MNNKILEIKELTKKYENKIVLNRLNLSVREDEITTIYGPSGAGKSTLLNILGLLEKYDSGSINFLGNPYPKTIGSRSSRKFIKENISYLFQNYALLNDLSIKQNLELVNFKNKKNFYDKKISLLKELNIESPETTIVGKLSGGEQQRIALVRSLLKPCKILLCDEPTGSLDPINKESLFKALAYAKKQGKTVLIVSHDPYIIENSDQALALSSLMKN